MALLHRRLHWTQNRTSSSARHVARLHRLRLRPSHLGKVHQKPRLSSRRDSLNLVGYLWVFFSLDLINLYIILFVLNPLAPPENFCDCYIYSKEEMYKKSLYIVNNKKKINYYQKKIIISNHQKPPFSPDPTVSAFSQPAVSTESVPSPSTLSPANPIPPTPSALSHSPV